jgi:hypothetical protein
LARSSPSPPYPQRQNPPVKRETLTTAGAILAGQDVELTVF